MLALLNLAVIGGVFSSPYARKRNRVVRVAIIFAIIVAAAAMILVLVGEPAIGNPQSGIIALAVSSCLSATAVVVVAVMELLGAAPKAHREA